MEYKRLFENIVPESWTRDWPYDKEIDKYVEWEETRDDFTVTYSS